ncbi:DUF2961 family protein [Pseudobacter ginsenosidimutans]|uniref:DUF2961 family protein n=2 Tax=Pseudobacter ginsenosidimutans TaxID=661488 RepID=A0A4Q7M8J3_9BACT|nr:DUF2961 domain-containing protein [Pseudobacter ginsenosidimutans]RZS63921.1 DUF2961 family protein [Pseudobacter ginsenosidimutans]
MYMKKTCTIAICLFLFSCFTVSIQAQQVNFESLLREMADREAIARYPSQAYTLAQFSSYDRATTVPGDSSWYANWDRSMFIRLDSDKGRKEYVLFDTTGPGAIVRFWMTFSGSNSGDGILRFYLDGKPEPVIQGSAKEVISGTALVNGPLAASVSDSVKYSMRGHNLYLPIPYAKSCRITYETNNITDYGAKKGEAVYYNINYRTYQQASVTSFSLKDLKKHQALLQSVQEKLSTRDKGLQGLSLNPVNINTTIAAGQSSTINLPSGSNAVRHFRLKLSAANLEQALRSTIVSFKFDGEQTVWVPAGDFFGTGYQVRYSNTWYSQVNNNGTMETWWVMPFQKEATLTLHNLQDASVQVEGLIETAPWKWDDRSMHFGANWRQYTNVFTGEVKNMEATGEPFDVNYVQLKGKGVYAGDGLTLFNTIHRWWGEGDEKVYIDGEKFPSHIGTGTEDYYGYAWCRPEKFSNHPFIAQPDGSGNFTPGFTVNMRYRNLDAIPFNKQLTFDMELWHWGRALINYAPVTYWYMQPGGTTNIKPEIATAKLPVVIKRSDIVSPTINHGKVEGENMELVSVSGGKLTYQNLKGYDWSDNTQAFWSEGKPGDKMVLKFVSEEEGQFHLSARLTSAPDYGKVKMKLNGQPVAITFDGHEEKTKVKMLYLGNFRIRKGENLLEVEITDARPNEKKTAYFGLDYLRVH